MAHMAADVSLLFIERTFVANVNYLLIWLEKNPHKDHTVSKTFFSPTCSYVLYKGVESWVFIDYCS